MHINSPFFDQSTHTTVFDELSSISYTHCRHIKHMHGGVWSKNVFFYKMTAMRSMLNISSDISFDIFNDLSGVIFSVHLNLPNVADCYLKNHLNNFFTNPCCEGYQRYALLLDLFHLWGAYGILEYLNLSNQT